MERKDSLKAELEKLAKEAEHHHHHHHDGEECDDPDCECHHHHDHDEHEHHHHHDGEECDDPECACHHHHDHEHEHEHEHEHHHHHHHADEVFTSWGVETAKKFTKEGLESALRALDSGEYGQILRAKGIVDGGDKWLHFDYVPGEIDIREGAAGVTGRLCVIGCKPDEEKLKDLFLR